MANTTDALKLALNALENHAGNYKLTAGEGKVHDAVIAALRTELSAAQAEPMAVSKKWILHGGFGDIASFDAGGVPRFYSKESLTKFKNGALATPCKGKNCGSMNGWLHSGECRAEHEGHYTTPQPASQSERQPMDKNTILNLHAKRNWPRVQFADKGYGIALDTVTVIDFVRDIEAAHGIKEQSK